MQPAYKYKAHIDRVVDGDTVDARVDLGFTVSVDVRFRLAGVDTPEIRSTDANVRDAAQKAKKFVTEQIEGKDVILESLKMDKYGRWLAIIHQGDATINDRLIKEGYAKPYFGGAKE